MTRKNKNKKKNSRISRISQISLIFLISLVFFSCSQKTIILSPDGAEYQVISAHDSVVSFSSSDISIAVDNRGNPSGFELILPAILSKDIEIDN